MELHVTLSRTDASTIDIAATDTNTQNEYATSWVQSTDDILLRLTVLSGAGSGTQDIKIVKGANITFTYTDALIILLLQLRTLTQKIQLGI